MDNLAGGHILGRTLPRSGNLKLAALSMIRNEIDIILPFIRHCTELFDVVMIADVQSVDGTKDIIESFRDPRLEIELYSVSRQEKYQAALMNSLARKAFRDGADWVFPLDADEFLDIESRAALEDYLLNFTGDLVSLPWINLVPSRYGSYASFDISQDLFWSGRVSQFSKIALSSLFAANNPQFDIWEGNHAVSPEPKAAPVDTRLGLPLLHVPCRSVKRFRYKISSALRVTQSKHNRGEQEGSHVAILDRLLALGNLDREEFNYIAANYGDSIDGLRRLDLDELEWPVKRMHDYVLGAAERTVDSAAILDLSHALLADGNLFWDQTEFIKGSAVAALIEHDRIRIVPQPVLGGGGYREARFLPLGDRETPTRLPTDVLADALSASCLRVKAKTFSAWSTLIPILFALFSVLRPRRYVELGVHNGMSFFAACQVTDQLDLGTECVAIDSWVGDEHAGIHTEDVFLKFQQYLKENYARQSYIKAYFSSALTCFDDGSVDLLHIDGLHTYEAVKEDFATWLPKMSSCGVVIFHDINVYERGFGVWRLWEDLKGAYPSYSFFHQHGLGILYVGREPHVFADMLRMVAAEPRLGVAVQSYFSAIGTILIEHCSNVVELQRLRDDLASLSAQADHDLSITRARAEEDMTGLRLAAAAELAELRTSLTAELTQQRERARALEIDHLHLLGSASWKLTTPFRAILAHAAPARAIWRILSVRIFRLHRR